jgi:hypothetical protein
MKPPIDDTADVPSVRTLSRAANSTHLSLEPPAGSPAVRSLVLHSEGRSGVARILPRQFDVDAELRALRRANEAGLLSEAELAVAEVVIRWTLADGHPLSRHLRLEVSP